MADEPADYDVLIEDVEADRDHWKARAEALQVRIAELEARLARVPSREEVALKLRATLGFGGDLEVMGDGRPYGSWANALKCADAVLALFTAKQETKL